MSEPDNTPTYGDAARTAAQAVIAIRTEQARLEAIASGHLPRCYDSRAAAIRRARELGIAERAILDLGVSPEALSRATRGDGAPKDTPEYLQALWAEQIG